METLQYIIIWSGVILQGVSLAICGISWLCDYFSSPVGSWGEIKKPQKPIEIEVVENFIIFKN